MSETKEDLPLKLQKVQAELKAPKSQFNAFGKYRYRSQEDILEAVKPILAKHGIALTLTDDIVRIGERIYVKSVATVTDGSEKRFAQAFAREPDQKAGRAEPQVTGASSSYARKYALNGLFAIDDNKDPDSEKEEPSEAQKETGTIPEDRMKEARSLGINRNKVAVYYKVPVQGITKERLASCIRRQKKAIEKNKANKGKTRKTEDNPE